jgi:hypothetical protein
MMLRKASFPLKNEPLSSALDSIKQTIATLFYGSLFDTARKPHNMPFHFNDGRGYTGAAGLRDQSPMNKVPNTPPIMAFHIIAAHVRVRTSTGMTRKVCHLRKPIVGNILCTRLGSVYWRYSTTTTYYAIANRSPLYGPVFKQIEYPL